MKRSMEWIMEMFVAGGALVIIVGLLFLVASVSAIIGHMYVFGEISIRVDQFIESDPLWAMGAGMGTILVIVAFITWTVWVWPRKVSSES